MKNKLLYISINIIIIIMIINNIIIKLFHFQNEIANKLGLYPNCSTQTQTFFLWKVANTSKLFCQEIYKVSVLIKAGLHFSLV